jgi:hypothetical protein
MENDFGRRDIQNGYRMEKPEYSPNFFRDMIKSCWQKDPKQRPTFLQLTEEIEKNMKLNSSLDYCNSTGPEGEIVQKIFYAGKMVEPTLSC